MDFLKDLISPALACLIAAGVCIVMLIGIILDKDWAVFIIRNSGLHWHIASQGRDAVRRYQGIGFAIGAIASLFLAAYYFFRE
ncbi:Immunity protein 17 [Capnocytophaga haemolytica]|jgi:hypothetical protein|uniref:Immunity protein 17 n=1 Tax=Capnocytophaga haemolytica TaxID=45243 RepID=A0AAX2H1A8_9FLAO|nr:Imm17 family immunity protein [Capnocytophaga haemolytica]AMD85636.1 hypothetical protein AXF12_08985 [Capnocytophaga haemolytica]SFN89423.1 Immunity protein 17 [Capnocytophaga haemolytica]SNV16661.1 Uncharacterised protein [Capnocytophaga haemolytica]